MAEIRGFRASRFTAEAGPLSRLIAPPSERLRPEERERLAAEPNNVVHATMPPFDPDDRSKFVRYARASAQLAGWRRARWLRTDEEPGFYRLTSSAFAEDEATLLALVPLTAILATEPAPVREREERLRMLEATRTYLEPVPLATEGLDLREMPTVQIATATTEEGETFTLNTIVDSAGGDRLRRMLGEANFRPYSSSTVEAAQAFRAAKGERPTVIAEDYLLAAIGPHAESTPSGLVLWSLGEFA